MNNQESAGDGHPISMCSPGGRPMWGTGLPGRVPGCCGSGLVDRPGRDAGQDPSIAVAGQASVNQVDLSRFPAKELILEKKKAVRGV